MLFSQSVSSASTIRCCRGSLATPARPPVVELPGLLHRKYCTALAQTIDDATSSGVSCESFQGHEEHHEVLVWTDACRVASSSVVFGQQNAPRSEFHFRSSGNVDLTAAA